MKISIEIVPPSKRAIIPFYLLLKADPSEEKIRGYIKSGKAIAAIDEKGEVIGICIAALSDEKAEIKNIAVKKEHQGTGIGKRLLKAVINLCRESGVKSMTVCTGNSSIGPLAFYQKCGFEIKEIISNYFVENYPGPIFENGIQCKHQIILQYEFTHI